MRDCRRPILSWLFCSFKYRNMLIVFFALIIFVPYLSLNVMLCMFRIVSCFSYFIYVKWYFILFNYVLQLNVFLINHSVLVMCRTYLFFVFLIVFYLF